MRRQAEEPTSRGRFGGAFSLIELVIVVVIIGIIGAIAVPRMSAAAQRAKSNALIADLRLLDEAIATYVAEHAGRDPVVNCDGSTATSALAMGVKLTRQTTECGDITTRKGSPSFGPYLKEIPANPFNGLSTVRINGAVAGRNTHGWRYDTILRIIESDYSTVEPLDPEAAEIGRLDVGIEAE